MQGVIAGRTLDFSPKVDDMETIAKHLLDGKVCFVRLEPGDMTRYDFYLIPQTPELHIKGRHSGEDPWSVNRYVWISPCNLRVDQPGDVLCMRGKANIYWDLTNVYKSEHTCKVITIFLDLVNQMMNNIQACKVIDGEDFIITALDTFQYSPAE